MSLFLEILQILQKRELRACVPLVMVDRYSPSVNLRISIFSRIVWLKMILELKENN